MKENVSFVCAFQARRCVKELVLSFLNNVEHNQQLYMCWKKQYASYSQITIETLKIKIKSNDASVHHPASLNKRHCRFNAQQEAKNGTPWMPSGNTAKAGVFNVRSVAVWYFRSKGYVCYVLHGAICSYIGVAPLVNIYIYICICHNWNMFPFGTIELGFYSILWPWCSQAPKSFEASAGFDTGRTLANLDWEEERKPQWSPFDFGTLFAMIHSNH